MTERAVSERKVNNLGYFLLDSGRFAGSFIRFRPFLDWRATTKKKVVNFLRKKCTPRQNLGYACDCGSHRGFT